MPKLNPEVANAVESSEDGFKPIPEGVYEVFLVEDVEVKEGAKGPYWKWTFEIPKGHENAGRRLWTNTSLSENAFFKLKETFEAFGVPTDTDTEDLVGKRVRAVVTLRTIPSGARKGEVSNEISKLVPLDGVPAAGEALAAPTAQVVDGKDLPLF